MPKKTLNEATVRQFMKLVNHKPATISNFISENYKEEKELEEGYSEGHGDEKHEAMDEGVYEEEEAMEEMAAPVAEEDEDADPVGDEPDEPMGDEPAGKAGEVDITPEMAKTLIEIGDMLKDAMPEVADDEDDMMVDEPADLPPPPAGDDDPAVMEAEDANEEMNEEEMIQEVARRVAARILKAKNAKKELDEALGKK